MSDERQYEVSGKAWDSVIGIVQEGLLSGEDVTAELAKVRLVDDLDVVAADEVWHRVVQALQESMLTMTDVYDTLRLVRVVERDGKLHLSAEYKQLVQKIHAAMVKEAEALKAKATADSGFAFKGN